MTANTTISAMEPGLNALAFARGVTTKLAEDIAEDQMTHRPTPNCNHTAWLLGHLAYADDGFYTKLSGNDSVIPENFEVLFGMGTTPSDDACLYPSKAELLEVLEKSHAALTDWFKSLPEEKLAEPLPEGMEMFGANHATLAATMAWHEGVHNGQLIEVRRSLGMSRVFG